MAFHWQMTATALAFMFLGCSASAEDSAKVDKEPSVKIGAVTLRIRIDRYTVPPGKPFIIRAELSNDGWVDELIYMPGLGGRAQFGPPDDKEPGRPDEYGPPFGVGRFESSDVQDNFVVLKPGDYYGRRYSFKGPVPCDMEFRFWYENKNARKGAWTGKSKAVEGVIRVRSGAEAGEKKSERSSRDGKDSPK
jgi:hypothetical protein